jgi:hypothetical protein
MLRYGRSESAHKFSFLANVRISLERSCFDPVLRRIGDALKIH